MTNVERPPILPIGMMRPDTAEPVVCPRCRSNLLPLGYPGALSRADNKTEICSPCGQAEGMSDWIHGAAGSLATPDTDWPMPALVMPPAPAQVKEQ